jgi:hypothetical protein
MTNQVCNTVMISAEEYGVLRVACKTVYETLTALQPILANGLLTDKQLAFIDPHIDLALTAVRAALGENK